MRVLVLAILTGCYSPSFGTCEVTCGSDSPCPEDLACGSDHFCRPSGDGTACSATLTVTTNQQGDGRVSSQPNGIDCSTHDYRPCTVNWPIGTQVMLQAQHSSSTSFGHWSGGACDGSSNPSCSFTLSGPVMINASFH